MKYIFLFILAVSLAATAMAQDKALMKTLMETANGLTAAQQQQVLDFAKNKGNAKATSLKKAMKALSLADQQAVVAYAEGIARPVPTMAQTDTKPATLPQSQPAGNGTQHAPMKESPATAEKSAPSQKSNPTLTAEEGVQTPATTVAPEASQNVQDISAQKSVQLAPATTAPSDATGVPAYMQEAERMPKTSVQWYEEVFDFGEIKQGTKSEHDFKFKNTGSEPLKITFAKASCGCTTPDWSRNAIPPGGEGFVRISFDSTGKIGQQTKTVSIWHNGNPVTKVLRFTGNVKE